MSAPNKQATARRTRGRPPAEASAGVREAILDVAECKFAEQGFAATPLREIAQQAGVNPAMVHYYFGSKLDLLRQVMERTLEPLARAIAAMRAQDEAPAADFAGLMMRTLSTHPNLPVLMMREVMLPGGAMRDVFLADMAPRLGGALPELLLREQRGGKVDPALDPRITALLLLALSAFPFIVRGVAEAGLGVAYDKNGLASLEKHVQHLINGGIAP